MIIGLTGQKYSGKDTVGAYLVKNYQFERRAFADKLKLSLAALFDIPPEKVNEWKWDQRRDTGTLGVDVQISAYNVLVKSLSWREILQRYGTEAHRDIFGHNFWVDQLLPVGGYYAGRALVITDTRFQNEVDRITELGGYVVRIIRNLAAPSDQDHHRSEQELLTVSADYTLNNDGTIEQLEHEVDFMLAELGVRERGA